MDDLMYAAAPFEFAEIIGQEWRLCDKPDDKHISIETSAGLLVLCKKERYHGTDERGNLCGGIRFVPIFADELEKV